MNGQLRSNVGRVLIGVAAALGFGVLLMGATQRRVEAVPPETRNVGVIAITADSFTDLGGGLVQVVGNIRLGAGMRLAGGGDTLLIVSATNSIRGVGVLELIGQGGSGQPVLSGAFNASGIDGIIVPSAAVSGLLQLAGFDVISPVLTIDIPNARISGVTDLELAPDDPRSVAQDVGFTLTPGPLLTGNVPLLDLYAAGVLLQASGSTLDSNGVHAAVAAMTLPPNLGGLSSQVQNLDIFPQGLGANGGATFSTPDLIFGDGSHLSITNNQGKLEFNNLTGQYQITIQGTLGITLPDNLPQTTLLTVALDQVNGQPRLSGMVDQLIVNVAKVSLAMDGLTLDIDGLGVAQAVLTLPQELGGGSVDVFDIRINGDGLHIGGASAVFPIPPLRIGDGSKVAVRNGVAMLAVAGGQYHLDIQAEVDINLPENAGITTTIDLSLVNGQMAGTVDQLTLSVAGATLGMQAVTLSNSGLTVSQATLTLPPRLGGETASIAGVSIGANGLSFSQAQISLPIITYGPYITLTNTTATFSLLPDNSGYTFQASATLIVDLPENDPQTTAGFNFTLSHDAGQGYQIKGQLSGLTMTVAGATLAMNNLTLGNDGFSMAQASLTLPPALGSEVIALSGVTITGAGLSFGGVTFEMPDLKLAGGRVDIRQAYATLTQAADGYHFASQGILSATLPENSVWISLAFDVAGGQVSATIGSLSLSVAGATLNMTQVAVGNGGLSAANATLQVSSRLGGGTATVNQVRIDQTGLNFGSAGLSVNLPDIAVGQAVGFIQTTASLSITNTGGADQYLFTAATTLNVALPDNPQQQAIAFTLISSGTGYVVDGTIAGLALTVAGMNLSLQNIDISNAGLSVPTATLTMPPGLGGATLIINGVSIGDGLQFADASITLPDIQFGASLVLHNNAGTIAVTGGHYAANVDSTLLVNLPGNTFASSFQFAMLTTGTGYALTGTLSQLNLDVAGLALAMSNLLLDSDGLSVAQATLTLPASLSPYLNAVTVNNVSISATGLQIGGGSFMLPTITFGGGGANSPVQLQNPVVNLTSSAGVYTLSGQGTLALTLPDNAQTVAVQFSISAGEFNATLSNLSLTVAGATLGLQNVTIDNTGLHVAAATLVLPAKLGNASVGVSAVNITADGLSIGGGSFALPMIKIGSGSAVNITNISANLAVVGVRYTLNAAGTLNLNLPGNTQPIGLAFQIDPNGDLQGSLSQLSLSVAGATLSMSNVVLGTTGLAVSAASLTLPPAFGGAGGAVYNVTIGDTGLHIGGDQITLPSITMGSTFRIDQPTATIVSTGSGYSFGLAATLQINLPQNTPLRVPIDAIIDSNGQMSATIAQVLVNIATAQLELDNAVLSNAGLAVGSGTLRLPGALGGVAGTLTNIVIDGTGLHIGGAGGAFPLPNIRIGRVDGFAMTGVLASLMLNQDGTYGLVFTGTVGVTTPDASASVLGSIGVDSQGDIAGTVQGFTLTVAGLALGVVNASIVDDTLSASEVYLQAPPEWGGESIALYAVSISPVNGVTINGGGAFNLPTIHAGNITIGAQGSLQLVNGGYQIQGGGTFGVKGLGLGTDPLSNPCSIGVTLTLFYSASNATLSVATPAVEIDPFSARSRYAPFATAGLRLQGVGIGMYNCSVPLGTTGFALTSVWGNITVDPNTTIIQVGVGLGSSLSLPLIGPIVQANGSATLDTGAEQVSLSGDIKVIGWDAANAAALISPQGFSGTLSVDAIVAQATASLRAWEDATGFHLTGSGMANLGIPAKSILNWIPQCDMNVANAAVDVGEFNTPSGGTTWGMKGKVTILSLLSNWGFFVGTGNQLTFSNIDQFALYSGSQLAALRREHDALVRSGQVSANADWKSGNVIFKPDGTVSVNVYFPQAQLAVFHLAVNGTGSAYIKVYDPNDNRICKTNESAWTCFSGIRAKDYQLSTTCGSTQEYYTIETTPPGMWTVEIHDLPTNPDYQFAAVGEWPPAPVWNSYQVTNSPAWQYTWQLQSPITSTEVTIYATYFEPAAGNCYTPWNDYVIASGLSTPVDGSSHVQAFSVNILPTGYYQFYLTADDGSNMSIKSNNTWSNAGCITPDELYYVDTSPWGAAVLAGDSGPGANRVLGWNADIEFTAGYRQFTVDWDRYANPNTDGYVLYVGDQPGSANPIAALRTITTGNATGAIVSGLLPDHTYYLAVKAYNKASQRFVLSNELPARAEGADFGLSEPAPVTLIGGQGATTVLTLTGLVQPFPEPIGLYLGNRPGGLVVSLSPRQLVPGATGTPVIVGISTTTTLPEGVYSIPIVASGAGKTHQTNLRVTVMAPRFTLAAAPAGATLEKGQSASFVVTATAVNGWHDAIRLDLDGAPAGLAWAFSSWTVQPGQSVTLVVTDTAILSYGVYTMSVSGADSQHTESANLVVTVRKPGFSIRVTPPPSDVKIGDAAIFDVRVTDVDGWTQPVTLTLDPASVPPHMAYGFIPATTTRSDLAGLTRAELAALAESQIVVNPPARVFLVLMTTSDTPAGLYLLRASAASGEVRESGVFALRVYRLPSYARRYYFPILTR